MPKALVLSNGSMLVDLEKNLQMSDFYYPHVGMEDHTTYRNEHRVGVYTDGRISWFNDHEWTFDVKYSRDSLVGNSKAVNDNLKVELTFEDLVSTDDDLFLRRIKIKNNADYERDIKIYFNTDLYIYGEKIKDTAEYEPSLNGVLHYRNNRYFLVFGVWEHNNDGISNFAIGKSAYAGKEGTWKDAEDGDLQGNTVEQGSVDSTVEFEHRFKPGEERYLNFMIAAGTNYHGICELHHRVLKVTPEEIYKHTRDYWKHWSNKMTYNFEGLDSRLDILFKRSLLLIKSQIDKGGAVIAANDSDIMKFNRDTYTYMWGRDSAIVIMAMAKAHYSDTAKDFFRFVSKLLTSDGYLLHKYNPDGSLGSSWHPKLKNGEVQLPIQEDETALPIFAFYEFYKFFKTIEFVDEFYHPFVHKAGHFMANYVYEGIDLPQPSYDPWEEQRGVFSYTCACTYGGLVAAASLAEATANYKDAEVFTLAAQKIKAATLKHLYSEEHGRFLKKVLVEDETIIEKDPTVDASLSYVWRMGMLPADDPKVVSTMRAIRQSLWVPGEIGGLARYTNDHYQREFDGQRHPEIPGNPWIITTLWYAQWLIEVSERPEDCAEVAKLLNWVADRANPAGILPEQVDPFDGRPLSVAPLTWSHAEYVLTLLQYQEKVKEFSKNG